MKYLCIQNVSICMQILKYWNIIYGNIVKIENIFWKIQYILYNTKLCNITYWDMYLYFIIVSIKLENENIKYLYNNIYYIYIIITYI